MQEREGGWSNSVFHHCARLWRRLEEETSQNALDQLLQACELLFGEDDAFRVATLAIPEFRDVSVGGSTEGRRRLLECVSSRRAEWASCQVRDVEDLFYRQERHVFRGVEEERAVLFIANRRRVTDEQLTEIRRWLRDRPSF